MREIRRRLRQLPRDRREEVVSSVREGQAVADPRDAALAAAWAENLASFASRLPWWLIPLERPRGWHARLWVVHLIWIVAFGAYAYVQLWSWLPGWAQWVLLIFLLSSVVTTPFTIRKMLRAYWNAPNAARRNRELAA